MKGNVIGFDPASNTGAITGYDGQRYDFTAVDWHSPNRPRHGDLVDFVPQGQRAAQVYLMEPEYVAPGFFEFYFSLRGRVSRGQYWLRYFLPVFAVEFVLAAAAGVAAASDAEGMALFINALYYVFMLATLWPGIAVLVKRVHDRDKPGWLVLLPYVLIVVMVVGSLMAAASDSLSAAGVVILVDGLALLGVMVWFFVEFGCLRGTVGANRYGPDPVTAR